MNNQFDVLFIVPPTNKKELSKYYTASDTFPVNVSFEFSHKDALELLRIEMYGGDFPSVILIDESFGIEQNLAFIEKYKNLYYLFQLDTALFITTNNTQPSFNDNLYPNFIAGMISYPFNKQQFMKEVYQKLKVYLV